MYVSYFSVGYVSLGAVLTGPPGSMTGQRVSECSVCHALVSDTGQYAHNAYHNREETLSRVLAAKIDKLVPDDPFSGSEWSDL